MSNSQSSNKFIPSVLKGGFTALITTLVAVLIFAIIIRTATLSGGVIKAVNQFIKALSVFLGCMFCVREDKGLIKGLIIGALSSLLTILVFSLITGVNFSLTSIIIDLLFLSVVGAICGVITVNVKGR